MKNLELVEGVKMPLKKSKKEEFIKRFKDFLEAEAVFKDENKSIDERIEALEYILNKKEIFYVLRMLHEMFKENNLEYHPLIDYAFANFGLKPKREEDFNEMFKMLKSDNAYLRNAAIKFLQEYGKEAKEFLIKLMNDSDRDIRIFAINILGDVKYEDSINMLREFIKKESDINALATAIDYLGEIGEEKDITLLTQVKEKFNDPYIDFAVDLAIQRIKSE